MSMTQFVSDNTPVSEPNILTLSQRENGDIEVRVSVSNPNEHKISFRMSGSRLCKNKAKIIKKFAEIIDLINSDTQYQENIQQHKRR